MRFLLDTNAISELTKQAPAPHVRRWIEENHGQLALSWVSVAELRAGLACMVPGKRRDEVSAVVESMIADYYSEAELPLGLSTSQSFAELALERKKAGTQKGWPDTVIAALARDRGLTVVTRNTKDFPGVATLNPWDEGRPQP